MTNIHTDLHTTPKRKRWVKPAALAAGAALLFGLGAAATPTKTETVEVEKVVEKRVDVPGPERIVTKTVTQDVTPAECKTYITLSEQAFDISAEAMGRAARLDAAGVNAQTAKLKAISPDLLAAKSACRSK
jgi:hypothetical protein